MQVTDIIAVPEEAKVAYLELTTTFKTEFEPALAALTPRHAEGAAAFNKVAEPSMTLAEMEFACQFADRLSEQLKRAGVDYLADEYDFDDASGAAFRIGTELELALVKAR